MNKQIYKDFDLPTKRLTGLAHYVPPRARRSEEIERRQQLPPGVLLIEQQRRGLAVAAAILKIVEQPEDVAFSTKIIAASSLNSSWYGFARGSDVMRRRLKLPVLGGREQPWKPIEPIGLVRVAADSLEDGTLMSNRLITAIARERPTIETYQMTLGRRIGNAGLALASANLGNIDLETPSVEVQALVRRQCLSTLAASEALGSKIGAPPSLAQLAEPDSPLSVYWRLNAPNGAYEALEMAVDA